MSNKTEYITLGAGCFWCVEAPLQLLKGVIQVESGYSGGMIDNPSYEQVCTGMTGHAEVCRVSFDPSVIALEELLEVFWSVHDPTTLNRQGNDIGTQYRSVIFTENENQYNVAVASREKASKSGLWKDPIVTQVAQLSNYYKAEDYHQNYYNRHKSQPYCQIIIGPKLDKIKEVFRDRLKG